MRKLAALLAAAVALAAAGCAETTAEPEPEPAAAAQTSTAKDAAKDDADGMAVEDVVKAMASSRPAKFQAFCDSVPVVGAEAAFETFQSSYDYDNAREVFDASVAWCGELRDDNAYSMTDLIVDEVFSNAKRKRQFCRAYNVLGMAGLPAFKSTYGVGEPSAREVYVEAASRC